MEVRLSDDVGAAELELRRGTASESAPEVYKAARTLFK